MPPRRFNPPVPADVFLLAALSALVLFAGLGRAPLWDDDETRFASVAREMLHSGDWVVPRFNGELADKPPLLFWAVAAVFSCLGETSAAARLPSAVFAALTVWATWRMARQLYDRTVAWWSAVALVTSLLFAAEARLTTTDAALLAFVSLAMMVAINDWWRTGAGMPRGEGPTCLRGRSAVLLGLFAGLGILTKGLAALILPALTLWLFHWWALPRVPEPGGRMRGRFRAGFQSLLALRPGLILAGALLVALPWHVLVWRETGGDWLRLFYLQHYLGRLPWLQPLTGTAMVPPHGHEGFPFFPVVSLLGGLFPWSVFLPLAAWRAFREAAFLRRPAAQLLVAWLAVWVVAVSFSSTQLPHYVFPVYPAAAMMISVLLVRGFRESAELSDAWLYAAAGGLAFGGVVLASAAWILAVQFAVPGLKVWAWLGAIPLLTAAVFAAAVRQGQRGIALRLFVVGATALILAVFFWGAPVVGGLNPLPAMVANADRWADGPVRLATYKFSLPGVVWNATRPVRVCRSAAELATFLRSGPDACALVSDGVYEEVVLALGGAPEILQRERPLLRPHEVLLIVAPRGSVPPS